MMCGLAFIEGGSYRIESKTLSSRLLTFAWCYVSMILLSSYTASLASFLVSRNSGPTGYLSTTSFQDLTANRFPVCVIAGAAPAALLANYLGDGYPIVYETGASMQGMEISMAEKMRKGECKAIAVTFFNVGQFLIGPANDPCDLRQLPAGTVTQIPARGGYAAAGAIMRSNWLSKHYGANEWKTNATKDAYGRTSFESTQCTAVPTAALGMFIRQFEGRSGEYPLKVARDAQLTRLRTNTCQNDGSPQPTRAEDQVITSNRIQPEGFLGLWLVLMGSMFVSFFTSPPTLKFLSTLKLGFYEKIYPEGRYGKRSSKITKMDALRESLRPPPSTADYREKVIAKLDDISEQLNAQLTKAEYPVGMPVGQGSAKTHP